MGRLKRPFRDGNQIFDLWHHLVFKSENRDFNDFGYRKCMKIEIRVTTRRRCVSLNTFRVDIDIHLFVYYNT